MTRSTPPTYHALGNGVLFCRVCQVTFVPDLPITRDPTGVRSHEHANAFRHREYARKESERDRDDDAPDEEDVPR